GARNTCGQAARLDVQRLGGDAQAAGNLLEDLGARLAEAALDLAEVGVGDARRLGQLAQRHLGGSALLADEQPEVAYVIVRLLGHVHLLTSLKSRQPLLADASTSMMPQRAKASQGFWVTPHRGHVRHTGPDGERREPPEPV